MALEPDAAPAAPVDLQRQQPDLQYPGDNSFVLFHNTTNRIINLYWCMHGAKTFHTTLQPGARCKTNTFTRHFWIFCDKDTNEMMCVEKQKVFVPLPYHIPDPNNPNSFVSCRKEIKIHLPMRTLRESCLWRAVTTLHTVPVTVAMDIIENHMRIPYVLKHEIKKRLRRKTHPELIVSEIVESLIDQKNSY
ncbi:protein Vhl [Eurosta solidaginis]|uniref:protein Vhl n=1 Tax=Eurosta solidaginis TaxID=178769 RepID=UPI003530F006